MRHTLRMTAALLLTTAFVATGRAGAQGSVTPNMPKVGEVAPDFTLTAATAKGISAAPVTLSSLKGRTVVLAFFPRQRSSGCTIQMQAYRDKYDSLFHGGKDVSLFGVSTDSAKDVASWAAEAHFQFTFLADPSGEMAKKYATFNATRNYDNRIVFVVAPSGKISYVAAFNPNDPMAYEALGKAINDAKGM
ncbi:MAG: redoxin domain-containing protein [Gemmatimonadota bacterium]